MISHDRYFLQKIPDRILELTSEGITEYLGKYDYYVEKKEQISSGKKYLAEMSGSKSDEKSKTSEDELSSEERRRLNKQIEAQQRRAAREKQALEEQLIRFEEEIKDIETKMCSQENISDYELLEQLGKELEELKSRYEEAFERLILMD